MSEHHGGHVPPEAYTRPTVAIDPEIDEELPWPSTLRSLHAKGSDWHQNACLGWSRGDWYTRIRGFRTAAELLASYVAQMGREQDGLIFPFLYNWRQHIELALKQLIIEIEQLLGIDAKPPFGHQLDELWNRCGALFDQAGYGDEQGLDNVAAVIAELHAMDPAGDAFRYPRGRDGAPTLPGIDLLSFQQINQALTEISNFLEAAETQISVELEHKLDYEREFSDGWCERP